MTERTLVSLFEKSVEKFPNNTLMMQKADDGFAGMTYKEIHKRVTLFASGLLGLNIQKGDRVALISEGRNDWVVAELGILYTGAINVPLSVKINELSDLKFRLAHSGCKFVVVSVSQLPKIMQIKKDLPELQKIIIFDEYGEKDDDILTKDELYMKGKLFQETFGEKLEEIKSSIKEDDPANICYTSGTTADPKGIVLSHRNYTANIEQASALLPIPAWYKTLLILPWDHAFAHTAGIYTLIANGASMASIELGKTPLDTVKNIPKNIKEIKPTFLLSVPALAQNFRKNIEKGIRQKGKKVENLFNFALKLAYAYNGIGWKKGRGLTFLYKPLLVIFDQILFKKVREGFGGELQFFVGGGALLDIELQRFFYAIGIPMYQGYGLTEAAPIISANIPKYHKLGSSGKIVVDLEVKIINDGTEMPIGEKGEIVVKGENVMLGYWNNETATSETIKDGWLYTGDIGYMDKDDFLYVLGREKSLLISNDGEKYSPEGIEEALTSHSPFIDQVMLYNNQSAYTIGFIVPNKDRIKRWLDENELNEHTEEGQKAVIKLFEDEVWQFRENGEYANMFPTKWLPTTFAILGEGFTEQNQLLNSTMKMVRGKIAETYQNRIDYMFTPEGKDIHNSQNKTIVSRLGE